MKRGDLVYFNYGATMGEDFGTVVEVEETAFGTQYWVRKTDFTLTPVPTPSQTVEGRVHKDVFGEEFLSVRGWNQIGAYAVTLT